MANETELKNIVSGIFAVVFACVSIGLFTSLCWVAAADAQGAIAFFIYAPVLFLLVGFSFFLGKYAGALSIGKAAKRAALVLGCFYLVFYASPFVGLGFFTDGVIGGVAKSFKAITGKSPMEWDKKL